MKYKVVLIFLLLIFAFINTASAVDTWESNSSMKAGILYTVADMDYYGNEFHPTTFYENDDLKVFFGAVWPVGRKKPGVGWKWETDTWVEDTSIVSGLPDKDDFKPEVFELDNTLYLVGGTGTSGAPNGWKRIGASWSSYDAIANGLFYPCTETFWDGDTLKAINYNSMNGKGFYWNGVMWVEDASIINGLSFWNRYGFAVFQVENDFKLIQDDYDHSQMDGFQWDDIIWTENSTISSGLGYPDVFQEIEVFVLDERYHAIVGSNTKINAWSGDDYVPPSTPEPTPEPTTIPVIAIPPPLVSTPVPTPVSFEPQKELIIFEEIAILIGKALSWAFILASYIGAITSHLLLKGKEEEESGLLNVLLFGTIGWVLLLLINTTGYITIVTESFLLNAIIFAVFGFVIYAIGNAFSKD